jgi:hypothetical protein
LPLEVIVPSPPPQFLRHASFYISGESYSIKHPVFILPVHAENMELLMLPGELLVSILASVDDIATLREVAVVCKRLNSLTEPFLYQSLVISDGSQAVMLAEAIAKRPSRAPHVRSLLASTRFEKAAGIEQLPGSLAIMHNLRDLSLETPDCNLKEPGERIPWIRLQERYERIFQHSSLLLPSQVRSLPRLRSCTSLNPLRNHHHEGVSILKSSTDGPV